MKKKTIALLLVMMMVFGITVGGTIAYLTDSEKVVNTFTVGDVQIKLDEAKIVDGKATGERIAANEDGTAGNEYHLLPGQTYAKDPTVTVLEGSEKSYVRMLVTVTDCKDVDDAIAKVNEARAKADPAKDPIQLIDMFGGYDEEIWLFQSMTKNEIENSDDYSRTYEFWYADVVDAPADDEDDEEEGEELAALFTSVIVPGEIDNTSLEAISEMQIIVEAHAIQEAGFETAELAWAAWN